MPSNHQDDFDVSDDTQRHEPEVRDQGRSDSIPKFIDRYSVSRRIGKGAFGEVFHAYDPKLDRDVALKIIKAQKTGLPDEGKTSAKLRHPNIVPIFDTGEFQGSIYFVFELIDGDNLQAMLLSERISIEKAIKITKSIASALHYAHSVHRVVHRDVKPANILVDRNGNPFLADFGIALITENLGRGSSRVGTPRYMSPEQAIGESHRVNGCSDIFSLGAVFYEMLTGEYAFDGKDTAEVIERIVEVPVRPLRQIDDTIPNELERICLRALGKRLSDRYTNAKDFADDLDSFLNNDDVSVETVTVDYRSLATHIAVQPKGLRSYDEDDAGFFLHLLPNPRDRLGVPLSISSWKKKIEESDPEKSFKIGLIDGPSGCGKSSWMRAGLLPLLSKDISTVYVEADASTTEQRLEDKLSRLLRIDRPKDLVEIFSEIRSQPLAASRKILVVIDQFEQWLNVHPREQLFRSKLAKAMRQCDATKLQVIVMVRTDFWNSINLFMEEGVEEKIVQNWNSTSLQLFDLEHSKRVLEILGKAYGKIPDESELTNEQSEFLSQAVVQLAENGGVAGVRLVLFAEMMKYRDWTVKGLTSLEGLSGIGAKFLSEMFSMDTSPAAYVFHAKAAIDVLERLVPSDESVIKGPAIGKSELLSVSGYRKTERFDELVRILDQELRLIRIVDRSEFENIEPSTDEPRYRLTHDYLIPSIRHWVEEQKATTKRGRAELQLRTQAAAYSTKPTKRNLLSLPDLAGIFYHTRPSKKREQERKLIQESVRWFGRRFVAGGCVAIVFGFVINALWSWKMASVHVDTLLFAEIQDIEKVIEQMGPYQSWTRPQLQEVLRDETADALKRLKAAMALVNQEEAAMDVILEGMLSADANTFETALRFVGDLSQKRSKSLWRVLNDEDSDDAQRFRAACILANVESRFSPNNMKSEWILLSDLLTTQLRDAATMRREDLDDNPWNKFMRPVRRFLSPILANSNAASSVSTLIVGSDLVRMLEQYREPDQRTEIILRFSNTEETLSLARNFSLLLDGAKKAGMIQRRRSLLTALSSLPKMPGLSQDATTYLLDRFRNSADPGIHGVCELALTKWGESDKANSAISELATSKPRADFHWYYTKHLHHSFAIIEPVENVQLGTPSGDPEYRPYEDVRTVNIPYKFAIGCKEVTVGQYSAFIKAKLNRDYWASAKPLWRTFVQDENENIIPTCPQIFVSFPEAAVYCNWLSEQEGIPKSQWCYDSKGRPVEGALQRHGYRLPTEDEWEFACRAGAPTAYYFGNSRKWLANYVWNYDTAQGRVHPVGQLLPNHFGLFDMLGNAAEWCHNEVEKDGQLCRVLRGGSFGETGSLVRCACRNIKTPKQATKANRGNGFRIARTITDDAFGDPP